MFRRVVLFLGVALLSAGCVPVSDGVGDIDKAEPDKNLLGSWLDREREPRRWVVDHPEVKGNPKGLMRVRVVEKGKKLEDLPGKLHMWFYTATIGKETYVNMLVGGTDQDLSKEGGYAKWAADDKRGFFVSLLTPDGDKLSINPGDHEVFDKLMKEAKFKEVSKEYSAVFKTTPGWLTAYLKETGPKPLFARDLKSTIVITRE
jgi:hypothetical protein